MPLVTHSVVTKKNAVASLLGRAAYLAWWKSFYEAEGIVLAFVDLPGLRVETPTTIFWHPEASRDRPPWLARSPVAVPKYHLLIREDSGYFYAGEAHLGSHRLDGKEARFTLQRALPREAWIRFGGYPSWMLTVSHAEHRIGTDDENKFRSLLRDAASRPQSHLSLTRYEEDSLHLYMNTHRGWLMYLREPGDSGLYLRNAIAPNDGSERFTCECGTDLEFPTEDTIDRTAATGVFEEFYRTGKLPTSVQWTSE